MVVNVQQVRLTGAGANLAEDRKLLLRLCSSPAPPSLLAGGFSSHVGLPTELLQ